MVYPERWLNVVGLGRMGREVLNEFCSETNPRKTEAEFFYFDKTSEIEKMRKNGNFRINNVFSLEELEKIEIPQLKDAMGTIFVAGLGGFKTGASALVDFGRDITTYYRNYPQIYGHSSVALVSLPFKFEGKEIREKALEALEEIKASVDFTIIVDYNKIPWDELTEKEAFKSANILTSRILKSLVLPLFSELGIIHLEWSDMVSLFKSSGGKSAYIGIGEPKKEGIEAIESALNNPLHNGGVDIRETDFYLLSCAVGANVTYGELYRSVKYFAKRCTSGKGKGHFIWGCYLGSGLEELEWTVFAIA